MKSIDSVRCGGRQWRFPHRSCPAFQSGPSRSIALPGVVRDAFFSKQSRRFDERPPDMAKGIGIDAVSISEMAEHVQDYGELSAFCMRTFSELERAQASVAPCPESRLAGCFAVKEAAYKALAHLTPSSSFDMRTVETVHDQNGCPHIEVSEALTPVLRAAGVSELLVSITNEGDMAIAVVLAL